MTEDDATPVAWPVLRQQLFQLALARRRQVADVSGVQRHEQRVAHAERVVERAGARVDEVERRPVLQPLRAVQLALLREARAAGRVVVARRHRERQSGALQRRGHVAVEGLPPGLDLVTGQRRVQAPPGHHVAGADDQARRQRDGVAGRGVDLGRMARRAVAAIQVGHHHHARRPGGRLCVQRAAGGAEQRGQPRREQRAALNSKASGARRVRCPPGARHACIQASLARLPDLCRPADPSGPRPGAALPTKESIRCAAC